MLESVAEHHLAYDTGHTILVLTPGFHRGRCHGISSIGSSDQVWDDECSVVFSAPQLEHFRQGRISHPSRRYTRNSCCRNAGLATACRGAIGWQYLVPAARYSCRSRSFAVGGPEQNSRHPSNKGFSTE